VPARALERLRRRRYSLAITSMKHLLMNSMTQWLARFAAAGAGTKTLGVSSSRRSSLSDQAFADA
jgi:hypothetical protein